MTTTKSERRGPLTIENALDVIIIIFFLRRVVPKKGHKTSGFDFLRGHPWTSSLMAVDVADLIPRGILGLVERKVCSVANP